MNGIDDLEPAAMDPRRLTPEQQTELRQLLIRRAQVARGEALRDIAAGVAKMLGRAVRWLVAAGAYWWKAWTLRRQRRAAIRELNALDDRMLRDIGLGRSEVESVVDDVERLMMREFTPARALSRPRSTAAGKCREASRSVKSRPLSKSAA